MAVAKVGEVFLQLNIPDGRYLTEGVMSIISTVAPGQASGKVAELYGQVQQAMGRVPNAFLMYSAS
jgi:hypothetical protein